MEELFGFIGYSFLIVIIYWIVGDGYRKLTISISCLLYVSFLDFESFILLVVSSILTYLVLEKNLKFKYSAFFIISFLISLFIFYKLKTTYDQGVFKAVLPLGLSFYLFRLIHYAIESYKSNTRGITITDFLSFMFYLPVIVVGPIIRINDWQKEVKRSRWDPQMFSGGLERILYGIVKIVFIGNYLFSARLAFFINDISSSYPWLATYLDCIRYAGNSYMQFAGYSDIAIGFSMLFGIRIMENFNFPFLALNINDFWKRWHISLSQWCRDYIFTPIASSTRLPWIAIISSMIVLGLWHELSPRYILWASFHGIGIVIWNFYNKYVPLSFSGFAKKVYDGFCLLLTLNFVVISFAWVKEASLIDSINIFKTLLGI